MARTSKNVQKVSKAPKTVARDSKTVAKPDRKASPVRKIRRDVIEINELGTEHVPMPVDLFTAMEHNLHRSLDDLLAAIERNSDVLQPVLGYESVESETALREKADRGESRLEGVVSDAVSRITALTERLNDITSRVRL